VPDKVVVSTIGVDRDDGQCDWLPEGQCHVGPPRQGFVCELLDVQDVCHAQAEAEVNLFLSYFSCEHFEWQFEFFVENVFNLHDYQILNWCNEYSLDLLGELEQWAVTKDQ